MTKGKLERTYSNQFLIISAIAHLHLFCQTEPI